VAAKLPTALREPLDRALEEQLRRTDLVVVRVWRALFSAGVVFALAVGIAMSHALGLWMAFASALLATWFTFEARWRVRGSPGRLHVVASTVVESAIPWIALGLLVPTQGSSYALASWVPPLLFGALVVASVARLRPWLPLAVGVASSAAFLLCYFAVVRPALPPSFRDLPPYDVGMQLSRALSLVFGGALGMLVSRGLRIAIGRAESDVRSRDLFGKYRIVRQVASGGMGTVHEAIYCPEGGFERRVAIKRVHAHLLEQPEALEAFRREAELSARLVHANIVQVFDFGRVGETYFLAMEYVDGLTLHSLMRRLFAAKRPLPDATVAHLAREILAGLRHSHEGARGGDGAPLRIIHRDLSPANVLLSRSGEVKISDFGLARALRDAESTRTKHVAGHVGYMAPEQILGHPLDPRCDLFGLGVILWELLAGRRLFVRENESATLYAMVNEPVLPITTVRSDLHPSWGPFFEQALARDPDRRFASAGDMAAGLEAVQLGSDRHDARELGELVEGSLELPERASSLDEEAVTQVDSRASVTLVDG